MGIINYLKLFVPRELNDDIYNSQSKDCNQGEKFFTNIDIFHEYKFANFTFTEFENVFNREYDEYIRLLKKASFFMLTYTDIDKLKSIKAKLYSLEKLGIKHFGEQDCLNKMKDLSFNILNSNLSKCKSNNLDYLIKYELDNINTKFDKFNLLVYRYNNKEDKTENHFIRNYWNKFNDYIFQSIVKNELQKKLLLIDNNKYLIYSDLCNLLENLPKGFLESLKETGVTDLYLNGLKYLPKEFHLEGTEIKGLSLNGLKNLPKNFSLSGTEILFLSLKGLKNLPKEFSLNEREIYQLDLSGLKELPKEFSLKGIKVRGLLLNGLKKLPKNFSLMETKVESLSLDGLKELPIGFNLNGTKISILHFNGLKKLPKDLSLKESKVLGISLNSLKELPKEFSIEGTEILYLILNGLKEFPKDFNFKEKNIKKLELNGLKNFSPDFSLKETKVEQLYLNGLKELPKEFSLEGTEIKHLSLNGLEKLPKDFSLKATEVEGISLDGLKHLPKEFSLEGTEIKHLSLNGLKELPKEFSLMETKVERLSLNGLRELPKEFCLKGTQLIGLSLYGLKELPKEFSLMETKVESLSLEGLKELSEGFIEGLKETRVNSLLIFWLKYIIRDESILHKERTDIVNFVKEYNSGACLLSGYRGVGKTSLIKESINHYKATNEDKNVLEIIINVPEVDKDKKGFDKTQLINRIVVAMYEKIYSNPHIPSKFKKQIFQQYLRVYNEIENKSTNSLTREGAKYIINTKAVVLLIIWLVVVFSFYKLDVSIIESLFSGLIGTVSFNFVYSFFVKKYTEKQTIEKTMKEIYNADIAETRIIQNIGNVVSGFSFNYLRRKIDILIFEFTSNIIKYIKIHYYLLFIYIILLIGLIGLLNLLMKYGLGFCTFPDTFLNNQNIFISFLTQSIKIINDNDLVRFIIASILGIILIKTINNLFYKPTKFIFVIDELDKLLDFEKNKGNMKQGESKDNLDMKQVFEVLSKLKTLFFDTRGAIFFIVTNKEAYDYYITHKHQEDDIVSNIFNKVIYLPMNSLSNFQLNYPVDVQVSESQTEGDNKLKEQEIRQKIQKYLYFKSHGNWRKSKFILSNLMNNNILQLNEDEINFDMQFYDFFYKLYQIFLSDSLEKFAESDLFEQFLFGLGENKGYIGRMYDDKYNETVYCPTLEEVKIQKSKNIAEALTNSNEPYYFKYLLDIKEQVKLISGLDGNNLNDLSVMENIKFLITRFQGGDVNKRDFFGLYVASIHRVNSEYAYRDYILNTLLNMFENIKFYRKISLNELFKVVRINNDDLHYPAFIDLIVFWLPLMLFYFIKNDFYEKE